MRQLALAVDLSVAAIYHHFPDKNALYLDAVRFSFSDKEQVFDQIWNSDFTAKEKLHSFIRSLIDVMLNDRDFHRLMQREILEADPERMQLLAQGVFNSQFCLLMQLMTELAPEQDAHLLATSAIGLAKYHIEYQPLLKNLPGWKSEHEIPEFIATHVTTLLLNSFQA